MEETQAGDIFDKQSSVASDREENLEEDVTRPRGVCGGFLCPFPCCRGVRVPGKGAKVTSHLSPADVCLVAAPNQTGICTGICSCSSVGKTAIHDLKGQWFGSHRLIWLSVPLQEMNLTKLSGMCVQFFNNGCVLGLCQVL